MATWKKVIVSGSNISQLANDSNYLIDAQDGAVLTGSFTGSFAGDGSGLTGVPASGIVLDSLTDGNGINDFTYNGNGAASVSVQVNGSTLTVGASGVSVSTDGITNTEIATGAVNNDSIANDSITVAQLSGSAIVTEAEGISSNDVDTAIPTAAAVKDYVDSNITSQDLDFAGDSGTGAVDLDSQSLTIAGGSGLTSAASGQTLTLNISASGVTNAMLEGSIANDKLANSSITIGDQTTALGSTVTAFSGSFQGDGAGLTNVPASGINLSDLTDGNGNQDFTYDCTSTATIALENDITIDNISLNEDLIVGRNLTVQGTASFQHTEDLAIADRFILLASGSNSAGDGGIVVQQTTQDVGEVFAFDQANVRWGVSGSFDASQNSFIPDAFMAAVVNTAGNDPNGANAPDARYEKKGNLYVASNSEDIWIYS